MKWKGDKKYLYWGITAVLVICSGILFYYFIFHWSTFVSSFKNILKIIMPIIDGAVLAYILAPITNFIERIIYRKIWKNYKFNTREKKWIRVLAIFITYLFFFCIVYGFFSLVIPEIYNSILNISIQFPEYVNNLENFINKTLQKYPEMEQLLTNVLANYSDPINEWLNKTVIPQFSSMFLAVTNGLFIALKTILNFIVGLIVSIYLIYNKEVFKGQAKKMVYAFMNRDTANGFIHNMRFTNKTFSGFIVGKLLDSVIIGFLCLIITQIIGTPYHILISVIIGVTNIIPFFGPFIGAIPSAFLVLMVDPLSALYFIIAILILQQIDGNLIGPKILGNSTGISGFWVIFAITVFGGFFGALGMLVGVPIFAVIYAAIKSYIKTKLQEKDLALETVDYVNVDYINENNQLIQISEEEILEDKKKNNSKHTTIKFKSQHNKDKVSNKNMKENPALNANHNLKDNFMDNPEDNPKT